MALVDGTVTVGMLLMNVHKLFTFPVLSAFCLQRTGEQLSYSHFLALGHQVVFFSV